jgi:hypothetical protein
MNDAKQYPYVQPQRAAIAREFSEFLENTGGNDPVELMNDLGDPKNKSMASTNIVRFLLATSVQAQATLLMRLRRKELI